MKTLDTRNLTDNKSSTLIRTTELFHLFQLSRYILWPQRSQKDVNRATAAEVNIFESTTSEQADLKLWRETSKCGLSLKYFKLLFLNLKTAKKNERLNWSVQHVCSILHQFYPLIFTASGRQCQRQEEQEQTEIRNGWTASESCHSVVISHRYSIRINNGTVSKACVCSCCWFFQRSLYVFSLIWSGPHSREM